MANLPPVLLPPNISKGQLLLSTQVYDIVDLLCEGPIYGFVDASGVYTPTTSQSVLKGVYLGNTPMMDTDNNGLNFQKFDIDLRLGSGIQPPLNFPKNTSNERIYGEDLIGPWDWDSPETTDPREYANTIYYGKWQGAKKDTPSVDQTVIPESDAIPINHEIENNWIDKVRVNISVDALYYVQHTSVTSSDVGRKKAHYIAFNIEYGIRNKNGTTSNVQNLATTIRGLCESAYGYSLEIDLPSRSEGDNVYLKITRTTPETVSPLIGRKLKLDSIVEIVSKLPFSYPLSVLAGWTIDARTFNQPPQRSYKIRGKLIRIPSNYYPLQDEDNATLLASGRPQKLQTTDWRRYGRGQTYATHTNGVESPVDNANYPPAQIYRGNWDGSFKWGWTDNPAWILYDLLVNDVYGLGNFIDPAMLDKFTLYQIGRYCDAVDDAGYFVGVDTLEGGLEPRYSCNVVIDTEQEAFSLINYIAGIFRGIAYWYNGGIYFADDRPKDPVMYFGNADVKDGLFNYQDTIKNGRFTVCEVAYNDASDNFLPKVEYVEDIDGIVTLGVIKSQTQAFGVTSRSEARRLGLYQLYSAQQEPEIVSFYTNLKATYLRPGDVIGISDEVKQIERYNGIINGTSYSSGNLYVNLDGPLPTGVLTGSTMMVTLPWGWNTLDGLTSQEGNGIPRYAVDGMRVKQFSNFPIKTISADRQTITISGSGVTVYNPPLPTSGDYVVNTGINIVQVPLSEAYQYIPPFSLYVAQGSGYEPEYYRVISVRENDAMGYEIGAVQYDSGKFSRLENEELGYDNYNDNIFSNITDSLRPPNPVRSLSILKTGVTGSTFTISGSWVAPITPPALAQGPSLGEPYPYNVSLTDSSGTVRTTQTTGTGFAFTGLSTLGNYNARVWSVGGSPNFLLSVPANASVYAPTNNYTYSGVYVTGMSIRDNYSGTYAMPSGHYYSTKPDVVARWTLVNPDASYTSGGMDTSSSPFGIGQTIQILDSGGSVVSGVTGYASTSLTFTRAALESGFSGTYPRDFYLRVIASGSLAPSGGPQTGTLRIQNPEVGISYVDIQSSYGLVEWDNSGSTVLDAGDIATGEIVAEFTFPNSGYGDINAIHVYTGDSAGFAVDSGSFWGSYALGGIPLDSESISISAGLTDPSGNLYANPYWFTFVIEDSIGTGAPFSSSAGIFAGFVQATGGDWYEDINNQLSGIATGKHYFTEPIILAKVTVAQISGGGATYPASTYSGGFVYVRNLGSGPETAYSDGTNWKRSSDKVNIG